MVQFDRVVMNPPFERGQDVEHVMHAYKLKAGGRLVALMSPHGWFAQDRRSVAFRHWLAEVHVSGGRVEEENLPEGSFKASGTGVNVRMLTIDKPAAVAHRMVAAG